MRLVSTCEDSTDPFKVEEFKDEHVPRYAILSHTWDEEEVSFQDMSDGNAMRKKGYKKIQDCCSVARKEGFDYVWIDTCCIDKTSSTELSEAINSMYRWYQDAHVCYAFLADVDWPTELASSRWFERGFTLQELIAPSTVVFYSRSWIELGTKESMKSQISDRTHIPIGVLSGTDSVEDASVAQRMSWASSRKTSRLEDEAYCLMGIFGINMPLLYWEGKAAFLRLQEEIMKVSDDYSIFCWKSEHPGRGGILADSANAFSDSRDVVLTQDLLLTSKFPWTTTNKGIHLELAFMGIGHGCLGLGVLPCIRLDKRHMFLAIWLRDQSRTMERFERVRCHELELIDLTIFVPWQFPLRQICIQRRRLAVTDRRTDHLNLPYPMKDSHMDRNCHRSSHDNDLGWIDNWLRVPEVYMTNQSPILGKIRSVNHREDSGLTGLFHAAATGNLEEAQRLLSRVKVNLQDAEGRTPLSYAAAGGHSMIVWLMLLARHKAKANMLDKLGRTPLSYAAEGGHGDVVWLLLSLGDIVVHSPDNLGLTPLIYAARGGHERIIDMLLGRDGFQNYLKDNDGRTVLLHASEGGHVAAVRIFLTRTKTGPDMQDKHGKTPLLLASMNGHEEVARALLAYGAEVETSTKFDETPLWVAALNGHEGVVRLLLPHNSSKLDWTDRTGRTLLHWAVIKGHASIVGLLLHYGASWKLRTEPYNTDAITQLLLGRGATANRLGIEGWTRQQCNLDRSLR
ncbi:predicted protein [Aspergillus terreus NIH2624]|uniref:Heterokaryon incompatibility domain-containing protein n=1 Tax=Aspergillus terreus (strain NIH 2624 / FGSC A1156) TaxID=341663 RepID=Q0CAP1_ASPTN|nr:uncharacterized protein ATEG_09243 [Aspergillus terreus NIH2624]EAU30380.1 predicted protein [Aspergillus terreus NIH2624]